MKRFDTDQGGQNLGLVERADGALVRHEDVQDLERRLEEATALLRRLRAYRDRQHAAFMEDVDAFLSHAPARAQRAEQSRPQQELEALFAEADRRISKAKANGTWVANVYQVLDAAGAIVFETEDIEEASGSAQEGGPEWRFRMKGRNE